MDAFTTTFVHLPLHAILVCKTHQQGILRSQLATHLDRGHRHLPKQTRQEIITASLTLSPWAEARAEVILLSQPIPHLPIFQDGYRCRLLDRDGIACTSIYRRVKHIQEHCRTIHAWSPSRGRGRIRGGLRDQERREAWEEGVRCQKLQPTGELGRLFQVTLPQEIDTGGVAEAEEERSLQREMELSLLRVATRQAQEEEEAQAHILEDDNRHHFHAWLSRAGWARHLQGFDRRWLRWLARKTEERERALSELCFVAETIIWEAQQACSRDVVGLAALSYVARRETGEASNEKPFNARQTSTTMQKYTRVWLSILQYLWRSRHLTELQPRSSTNTPPTQERHQRPCYQLTARQMVCIYKVEQALQPRVDAYIPPPLGSSQRDSESDGSEEEEEEEEEGDALDLTIEPEEPATIERLHDATLSLLLSLIDHPLGEHEYSSVLLSGLAILGIDIKDGWKSPLNYTPILSAVVTVAKMLVLYSAHKQREAHIIQSVKDGWGRVDAEEIAPSHLSYTQEMTDRYLVLSSQHPTPIGYVLRLRTYGKGIAQGTYTAGKMQWRDETLHHGYVQFSMTGLRSMVHGLVEEARITLWQDLLLLSLGPDQQPTGQPVPLPLIPWAALVDDPAEMKAGWSFLQDSRNTFDGVDGKTWLSSRVPREPPLRTRFVDAAATRARRGLVEKPIVVMWRIEAVQQYHEAMRRLREQLLVLVYLTGGQPPRSTELVTVTYQNVANSEGRGVFVEDGLLACVTRYHKGIGASAKAKTIYRYLPREVGELLLYYLWIVVPFGQQMESIARGQLTEGTTPTTPSLPTSPFIWEPVPEIALLRPQRRRARQRASPPSLDPSPSAAWASCRERWGTNQVRRALERVSLRYLGSKITIAIWRQSSKTICDRYLRDPTLQHGLAASYDSEEEGEADDPFDMQTGHTSSTAMASYGRLHNESPFTAGASRQRFRKVSEAWHRFLHFPSTQEVKNRHTTQAERQADELRLQRWTTMRATDQQAQLQVLLGPAAQFRGMQQQVVDAVLQQKSPIVAVMATGAGKSLAFLLPASCSSGVTVVVVPLLSLQGHMADRCQSHGIDCIAWTKSRPRDWASVVLVTPEQAVTTAFGDFLFYQHALGRLDRVVVDECHTILDSTQSWRTRLLRLRELVLAQTQLVYLTATLEPRYEEEFIRLLGLPTREQCCWFRERTTRTNIAYQLYSYQEHEEEEGAVVARLVQEKRRQYPLPGQILVYCDTVAKTIEYASLLGAVCYHRAVGTPEEKTALVRQLTEGKEQVFVATNALGLGVDQKTIRVVLHAGHPRKLRDYVQETGRAGRDAEPSEAILLCSTRRGQQQARRARTGVDEAMSRLAQGNSCLRIVIDGEMDGRIDRVACEPAEQACSVCARRQPQERRRAVDETSEAVAGASAREVGPALQPQRVDAWRREEFERENQARRALARREQTTQSILQLEVLRLEDLLREWSEGCAVCRVLGSADDINTRPAGHVVCEPSHEREISPGVQYLTDKIHWEKFSGCFYCGLPRSICERWERVADGGWARAKKRRCQYPGVLFASITAMWTYWDVDLIALIEARMVEQGVGTGQTPCAESIVAWMSQKIRWGGVESNQMCWLFCALATKRDTKR